MKIVVKELIDFFKGQERFRERNDYLGMEASSIPDLFINYFEKSDEPTRKNIISTLIDGALGINDELVPYSDEVLSLLLILCIHPNIHRYSEYIKERQEDIEADFNNSDNINLWIQAGDNTLKGLNFRTDWHYPLVLWGILYLLKSEKINNTYQYLLKNAQSRFFREALIAAKETYDKYLQNLG